MSIALVQKLEQLTVADLAVLRGAAGKPLTEAGHRAQAVFYRVMAGAELDARQEAIAFLVATLYGLYPYSGEFAGNLGATLRLLGNPGQEPPRSLQLRLARLVEVDMPLVQGRLVVEEMSYRLRQVIKQAEGRGAGISYGRLLSDLLRWHLPGRAVQRQWIHQFFAQDSQVPGAKERMSDVG